MKGETKITIEIQDDTGTFPIKETFIIQRDNTYEDIEEWIEAFKKILYVVGFASETINEVFPEE